MFLRRSGYGNKRAESRDAAGIGVRYLKRYGLWSAFAVVMAGGYLWVGGVWAVALKEQLRLLCDAFAIPGVLLLCLGALIWTMGQGALDGLTYSLRLALGALIPGKRLEKEENYGAYVASRRAKSRGKVSDMLICGGVAVGISLVFLALYYLA